MNHRLKTLTGPSLLSLIMMMLSSVVNLATAQQPQSSIPRGEVNYILNADMPHRALGQARLMRRGPVHAYYQPVMLYAPDGASISLASGDGFTSPTDKPLRVGMQVGAVYRFQITGIAGQAGVEVFPSLEIIDRTYPPPGQAAQFPIPIHIDGDDIEQALAGRLVTRVIYLEDPQTALPVADEPNTQRSFESAPTWTLYRKPIDLVVRWPCRPIGSRVQPTDPFQLQQFLLGNPPWLAIPDVPVAAQPEIRQ